MGLQRWQFMVLLLIGTALIVKCHEEHEKGFEEDGGEEDKEDHFDEESHKGDKGFHKKVTCSIANRNSSNSVECYLLVIMGETVATEKRLCG